MFYKDTLTGDIYQTADRPVPGETKSRLTETMERNPERYKPMTEREVEAHFKKLEKAPEETIATSLPENPAK